MRSILHIGADKCGSSSIQSFLSHHRAIKIGEECTSLTYACLTPNGLKTGARIEKKLKRSIGGYVNSMGVNRILQLPEKRMGLIQDSVREISEDLIFSCEGWLRALSHQQSFTNLLNVVAPPASGRGVELVAFVRAPVKWINSAWWQWGIWGQDVDFDKWLDTAIGAVQWFKYLGQAKTYESVNQLNVEPVDGDVVRQLIRTLDIRDCDYVQSPSNQSLPAEALQLFVEHRQHRPHAHASFSDFLIGHSIASNSGCYTPTPWVLNPDHIHRIIKATNDSNHQLLELMTDPWKKKVLDDPYWWEPAAYQHTACVDPYLPMNSSTPPSSQLASDLFRSLGEAVKILSARGLMAEYLQALEDISTYGE